MNFYKGKNVLVTGGTGLIGRPLTALLCDSGASVRVVSLDSPSEIPQGIDFVHADLREASNCAEVVKGIDIVFHLAGVKGSPQMARERPASFMVPTITFSFNMMEAARQEGVERYLFTSSVGVYAPSDNFREDDVWKTFPSPNDRFAGWAKRMGELQAEAYAIEYGWDKISIVRPANVYGPYDNFNPENAMVIPSLIHRALSGESPLTVWGDGSAVRDFIHARDVAIGMMIMVEKGVNEPVNLGSGEGFSIKEIAETVVANLPKKTPIIWDKSKPSGDAVRLMDVRRAANCGFVPSITLSKGISETMDWYRKYKETAGERYNAFTERRLMPND